MDNTNQFEGVDRFKHSKLQELVTSLRTVDINGKQVIQLPDGEFAEYVLMEEAYFVDNWLTQFAIGHVGKRNYFNHDGWYPITDGFTKGVIVLNTDSQPVVLIRKFIDMDLNLNQASAMDHWTRLAGQAAHIPDKATQDAIITGLADKVSIIAAQNPEYDTLTALVPYEYYLSKGIDPAVLKQLIYIRDSYHYKGEAIDGDSELFKQLEAILYKNARGEKIERFEVELVNEITNGEFIFNDEQNKVDDKKSEPELPKDFNPLSD